MTRLHDGSVSCPLVFFVTLYAYCFRFPSKQTSNEQSYMPTVIDQQGCQTDAVITSIFRLQQFIIITACRRRSLRRQLVADLRQIDQLTWRMSRRLTQRLCANTWGLCGEGMLITFVSELLEIAVQIIEDKKIIPFQPQNHVWIIREVELLEWIWYT